MKKNIVLNLIVIANANEFKVLGFNPGTQTLKVKVKAKPISGLANKEIEKKLSKFFLSETKIVFGKKSKHKKILIQNTMACF